MNSARRRLLTALGLALWAVPARAQVIDAPPPAPVPPQAFDPNARSVPPQGFDPNAQPPRVDVTVLVTQMSERVQSLRGEISEEMGRVDAGRYLASDVSELSRAMDDLRNQIPAYRGDAFRIRQQFTGIDASWRRLRAQLNAPGLATPGVVRASRGIDEVEAQLVAALGMNAIPADYYASNQPPAADSLTETRRLAHALVDRADAVAAYVRSEMGPRPGAEGAVRSAVAMARAVDRFHDAIDAQGVQPTTVVATFNDIAAMSIRVREETQAVGETPNVQSAWRSYRAAEDLIRSQVTRIVMTPPVVNVDPNFVDPQGAAPPPNALAATVVSATDVLLGEVDNFMIAIRNAQGRIPEWEEFLVETQRLRDSSANFRNDAAQGIDATRLAFEFRDVDADWQRLARRLYRASRGQQFGPNIDTVKAMGITCGQIHQILGMPGYAPNVADPSAYLGPR